MTSTPRSTAWLAVLPMRLRLNQDVIAFLVTFCKSVW